MKLDRFNGWQRLWFVATILFVLLGAFRSIDKVSSLEPPAVSRQSKEFRALLQKNLADPACAPYRSAPFYSLPDLPTAADGTSLCGALYLARGITEGEPGGNRILSVEDYDAILLSSYRWEVALVFGWAFAAVILSSSALYLMGWALAWIRRGFSKPPGSA